MDRRVRIDSLLRLQLKTSRASLETARWQKDKNLPTVHFETLVSFRAHALSIVYSRFGSRRGLQTDAF